MPDPEGFADFVRACTSRLYRVSSLLTGGDLARAEDLVAETLARVYLAWPRIRSGDAFGYARRTLVNLHNDWWRGFRRRGETLTGVVPEPSGDREHSGDHGGELAERDGIVRSLRRLTIVACPAALTATAIVAPVVLMSGGPGPGAGPAIDVAAGSPSPCPSPVLTVSPVTGAALGPLVYTGAVLDAPNLNTRFDVYF